MKCISTLLLLFAIVTTQTGCATVISGSTQKISVTSSPSDADATADGVLHQKTPTHFVLDRKSSHFIEISKDGYKSVLIQVRKTFNEVMAGNVLIGGLIGGGVDLATGANNKLIPERIDVVLEPGAGRTEPPVFASKKDQDFYSTNILKPVEISKGSNRQSISDTKSSSSDRLLNSSAPITLSKGASSNFGPKTR